MYTVFSYSGNVENPYARFSVMASEFGTPGQCIKHVTGIVTKKFNEIMQSSVDGGQNFCRFEVEMDSKYGIKAIWGYGKENTWIHDIRKFRVAEVVFAVNTDNVELTNEQQQEKSEMRNRIIEYFKQKEHKQESLKEFINVEDINLPDNEQLHRLYKVMVYPEKTLTLMHNVLADKWVVININNWSYKMLKELYIKIIENHD